MKELTYLFSRIAALSAWIKVLIYLLLSGLAIAIAGYFGLWAAGAAGAVCLVIGLLLLTFSVLADWARRHREAELRGELDRNAGPGAHSSGSLIDPLRTAFAEGLSKFRAFNKSVYDIPWFALIGDTGSGKSQAILRSEIDFPQGLHEPSQGKAPTQALDWWFTNFAVVLDTAGGLVFSPTQTPSTPAWYEFGELLRKHRRKCPLNGLVIAISAESLLKDSRKQAEIKSGVLARHLDSLRRVLSVRFPVFVLVTQCDRLPGFSPFFADAQTDAMRQQMVGWSNPAPLEAPFRPELVQEYFHVLSQRLRRRRLGVLLDPAPAPGGRRIDEVDTLFAFPDGVSEILPNLMIYAENMFVAGEWSMSPLPLRGIYLTSAQPGPRETPAADRSAPSAQAAEPAPAPLFLRDVFLDKIFREDALVTRRGTGSREGFLRKVLFFLAGSALLVCLFLLALRAHGSLLGEQDTQISLWNRAARAWKPAGEMPIVSKEGDRQFRYDGNKPVGSGALGKNLTVFEDTTILEFHRKLARAAANRLPIPVIFTPYVWLGTNPDRARAAAQRVLFEATVVKPLLGAARAKMSEPSTDPKSVVPTDEFDSASVLTAEAKALAELVRVEAAIYGRSTGKFSKFPGSTFLSPLLEYTTGKPADARLIEIMNWTYDRNPAGVDRWAPDWMGGGVTLQSNPAILVGTDRLIAYAQKRIASLQQNLASLQILADVVANYTAAENALGKAASVKDDAKWSDGAVANAYEALEAAKIQLEENLTSTTTLGLFEDGPHTLSSALGRLASESDSHLGQVDVIINIINEVLPLVPEKNESTAIRPPSQWDEEHSALLIAIRDRLTGLSGAITKNIREKVSADLIKSYQDLDAAVLAPYQGTPGYLWRWKSYGLCAAGYPEYHFQQGMYLVDQRWIQLATLQEAIGKLQATIDLYTGSQANPFLTICNYFLKRIQTTQTALFVTNYGLQAREALIRVARFPLVWPPGPENEALSVEQLQGAAALLNAIALDLQAKTFLDIPAEISQPLSAFYQRISPLYSILSALIDPDGSISEVTLTLYNGQAQRQLSGPNFLPLPAATPTPTPPPRSLMSKMMFGLGSKPDPTPETAPSLDISAWNAVGLDGPGQGVYPLSSQSDVPLGTFQLQQPFSFRVYHSLMADDGSEQINGGANWSALRLIARFGSKPLGVGQDWQVSLKPNEPSGVWIRFAFERPLPITPWPTIDTLGLRQLPGQPVAAPAASPPPAAAQP